MLINRLCYLLILLCTTVFFICFNGYLSLYVFALSVALPVLSVLFSLPGMLTLWVELELPEGPEELRTAKAAQVTLRVLASTHWPVPSGRVRVSLTIENRFTGESRREKLEFSPGCRPMILVHSLSSATCGVVGCRLAKARAYDLLGLVWLPVRLRENSSCRIVVQPTIHNPLLGRQPRRVPEGGGDRYSKTRPGDDPTELFSLREYRPGDRISRINWKLSQKAQELLVREGSMPMADRVLFLMDLSGTGLEADASMDILATLSNFLAEQNAEHVVAFSSQGTLAFLEVEGPDTAFPVIESLLETASRGPLPPWDRELAPTGISRVVFLCPAPDPDMLNQLRNFYPSARLTLFHLSPLEPQTKLPLDVQAVHVRPGSISSDLSGILL